MIGLLAALAMAQQPACPDSNALSRTLADEITSAHSAWVNTPAAPVPMPCIYTAIAKAPYRHADSVIIKAIDLSGAALERTPENPEILAARMVLLSRARRYGEIQRTMNELFVARASATNEEMHRLTVAAVMQLHDTAAIVNRLANAATRFPRAKLFAPEYDVWRQLPRLRALIDTVHRTMKKDPTLVVGFVNLSSIYGNLDQPDSALVYARRALRAGNSRDAVGKALESLLGVRLRRSQILATPEVWAATLPVARAVDSTLSTPASKYLVALSLSELVAEEARLAQYVGFGIASGEAHGFGRQVTDAAGASRLRVLSCARLDELAGMIVASRAKLDAGGDRFAPETVPAIRGGLAAMSSMFAQLKPKCS